MGAVLAIAAGAFLALVVAAPAAADVDDFVFDSFDAVYELGLDAEGRATLAATETIVAEFPDIDQNRGIIRAIPLEYQDRDVDLEVLGVTDETGAPVFVDRDDEGGFALLSIDDDTFKHGATTYVISYTMRDVIAHFEGSGTDEFYWDVNGDGWAQPFGTVSATVRLDQALAERVRPGESCYRGAYGATDPCEIVRADGGFTATAGDLGPYETLTIDIPFEGGTVVQPADPRDSWILRVWPLVVAALAAALAVLALVLRFVLWRDPKPARAIIAQYEPPEEADLRVEAQVIGATQRIVPAILIDAAVRGAVRIVDLDPDGADRRSDDDRYALELVDLERLEGETERELLRILFDDETGPGERVLPGAIDKATGAKLYGFISTADVKAAQRGLREKAKGAWARWIRGIVWFAFASLAVPWGWAFAWGIEDDGPFGLSMVAGVLAVVTTVFTSGPMRLSRKGADLRDHLRGLRLYLTVAEEDRIRVLQSPEGAERTGESIVKLYERLLPYAVLWGVEREWAEVLNRAYTASAAVPEWTTTNVLQTAMLTSFANSAMSHVAPITTSSSGGWSSSGGSSFSSGGFGGGFSGGGGGGGGGGGR